MLKDPALNTIITEEVAGDIMAEVEDDGVPADFEEGVPAEVEDPCSAEEFGVTARRVEASCRARDGDGRELVRRVLARLGDRDFIAVASRESLWRERVWEACRAYLNARSHRIREK